MTRALVCAVALIAAGCSAPKTEPVTGASLYQYACARCHGDHGEGGEPRANGFQPVRFMDPAVQARLTDDMMRTAIKNGRPQMPPFRAAMTDAQIDLVIQHLRTLGQPAQPAKVPAQPAQPAAAQPTKVPAKP